MKTNKIWVCRDDDGKPAWYYCWAFTSKPKMDHYGVWRTKDHKLGFVFSNVKLKPGECVEFIRKGK